MSYSSLVSYYRPTKNHGSRDGLKIRGFAIHCFVGQVTAKRGVDYFAETDRDASANYVIGYDGQIGCSVDDEDRAWTTSNSIDKQILTIEMASDAFHPYKVTDEAYAALIDLLVDRCKAYGIPKLVWKEDKVAALCHDLSDQNMVVHRWFDAKACPGDYLYNLHYQIAEDVNKRLASGEPLPTVGIPPEPSVKQEPEPAPEPEPEVDYDTVKAPIIGKGDEGESVVTLQGALQGHGYDLTMYGGADGIFGYGTEQAVLRYQQDHGLQVDGVVGAETWGRLLRYN